MPHMPYKVTFPFTVRLNIRHVSSRMNERRLSGYPAIILVNVKSLNNWPRTITATIRFLILYFFLNKMYYI